MNIGKATLLHIDCMQFMAGLPDKAFDLAIVDPPYRDDNEPTKSMRLLGNMKIFGKKPSAAYFSELMRVSQNQIIWGGNNFISNLRDTNCMLFWNKNNPGPHYSDGEFAWTSFDSVSRCFNFTYYGSLQGCVKAEEKIHPTQKPRQLYEWLLKEYAKPGQRILDTHLGSGSSAIACNNLGFEMVGCELDEDYYQAACARVEQATKQERLFA